MKEIFVGIDLHKKFFTFYATDLFGNEVAQGKLDSNLLSIDTLLSKFRSKPKVVVEAMGSWMWFVRALRSNGCEVLLAHPLKVLAIAAAKIKTDSIDAKTLCHLLRSNLVPTSYIATDEEQDARELSRGRATLVHDRTQLKNRVHAILTKENLAFLGTDMFGTKGRVWLSGQELPDGKKYIVDTYLKKLDETEKAIMDLDGVIKEKSSSDTRVKLLLSIPGIGPTTAFLLASEIGDIQRFPTSKQFASYFGLVPRLHQSGSHAYYGRITKEGNPYVRWVLTQAAQRNARYDEQSRKHVVRLAFRTGYKKAITALARELATVVYCVLKEKRLFIKDYKRSPMVCPAIIAGKS